MLNFGNISGNHHVESVNLSRKKLVNKIIIKIKIISKKKKYFFCIISHLYLYINIQIIHLNKLFQF